MIKHICKRLGLLISNVFMHMVYGCRKRNFSMVVFGAWYGDAFSDNSRFLFQYLNKNKDELHLSHVVWLTRNARLFATLSQLGYEVCMFGSSDAKRFLKKAGFHIVCCGCDDIGGGKYSYNAIKVNLWHGLAGIKGVNFASNEWIHFSQERPRYFRLMMSLHRNKFFRKNLFLRGGWEDCYFTSTTQLETNLMQKYFELPSSHFLHASYARLCPCLEYMPHEKTILSLVANKKSILYLPTFRNGDDGYEAPLHCKKLIDFLERNNILWIEKKHAVDCVTKEEFDSEAIIRLDSSFDISVLIPHVCLVISDYSSVVFDALYHQIPVFFYMPDFDYYAHVDRGFVLSPDEFLFGKQTYAIEELVDLLEKYKENFDASMPKDRDMNKDKYWGEDASYEAIWNSIAMANKKKKKEKDWKCEKRNEISKSV